MVDYGTDFFADDDLADDLRTVTGLLVPEQAIYRRLGTARGTLVSPVEPPDERDADYGTLLEDLLSLGQLPGGVFAIQAFVATEVNKEDEVDPAQTRVLVTLDASPTHATATISISGGTARGPFSLVLGVDAFASGGGTVQLLSSGSQQ